MRAIEITLTSGEKVMLREPKATEMSVFLRAMPSILAISEALAPMADAKGVILPVNLPDNALEGMYPLMALMVGMEDAAVREMGMFDFLALVVGFTELIPRNFFKLPPTSSPS